MSSLVKPGRYGFADPTTCILLLLLLAIAQLAAGQGEGASKKMTVEECLSLADKNKQAGDVKEATRYLNEAAMKVWEDKNYDDAIKYFNQSIELNKQINNASGIAKLNSNLGMIYSDLREFEKSLNYFQASLEYRLRFGEKTEIISTHINKAVVLNSLKRYNEAILSLEEALRLSSEMSDANQMKSCYGMLAETYEKAGNQEKTIYYFNLYRTFHEMVQRNKLSDAKREIEAARLHALETELQKQQKELKLLATSQQLKEKEGELSTMSNEMKTLLNNNTKQQLAVSLLRNQLALDNIKIAETQAKNSAQKMWITISIAGLTVVILFAVVLYRNYWMKKKLNLQLSEQNEEIKTLNESLESQVMKRTMELQSTLTDLKKRNRDLDQFSHVISHNLRGPVANILGLGKVINLDNPSDPHNIEVFHRLLGSTKNLDAVVTDLSVILQVQDNQSIPKEEVEISGIVDSVTNSLRTEMEATNAEINITNLKIVKALAVKPYLESIIYNLLSNAIKYRAPLRIPIIMIESKLEGGNFFLSVTDNGTGISDSNLEKVFEPYKRLTMNGSGKGLGLYLVRTQVEAMGGRVEVRSEEGVGSRFTIYIPQNS